MLGQLRPCPSHHPNVLPITEGDQFVEPVLIADARRFGFLKVRVWFDAVKKREQTFYFVCCLLPESFDGFRA